jgi:anti-sigma factor RsiW
MDHSQFKANQTAAVYVADGLDASTLEAFEMHMMACPECVEDVETWRAIKINMPSRVRPLSRTAVLGRKVRQPETWRMAASFLAVAIVGAAAGWFGRDGQSSSAGADSRTVFFNMPTVERGDISECTPVQLSAQTRVAVLRVPNVTEGQKVVAVDSDRHELSGSRYSASVQPDGSELVQIDAQSLVNRDVHLEGRRADGAADAIGCVTGQIR